MKIKILKPKNQILNSKLNELHFVEFIKNTSSSRWKNAPKEVTIVCFHPKARRHHNIKENPNT